MELTHISPAQSGTCNQASCRPGCALQVVDHLLSILGPSRGEDVDTLLDFRFQLHRGQNPEEILSLFCKLRRSLEQAYYLEFFRLRRWLENHIEARVTSFRGGPDSLVPIRLNFFCVEAIRYYCLARTSKLQPFTAARVQFTLRPVEDQRSNTSCPPSDYQALAN